MKQYLCKALLTGTSVLLFGAANAQTPANNVPASNEELTEVMVTGSRVITNGNDSPTPVTVVTTEQMLAVSPTTVVDAAQQYPRRRPAQRCGRLYQPARHG